VILLYLFLSIFPFLAFSKELTACYKAYYLFIPVAQTCITYAVEDTNVYAKSWVRTINVGKLVKRVYNNGESHMKVNGHLKPGLFKYHQEEGLFKRYQEYKFENGKIYVKEINYVDLTDQIEKVSENVYTYQNSPDPYMASLILFKESQSKTSGSISMFYDDKFYKIPYKLINNDEPLDTKVGTFRTRLVEVQPNIRTKGLLRPKGNWKLWIDKDSNLPLRMQLSFVIGSVTAQLEEIRGDRAVLKEITNYIR